MKDKENRRRIFRKCCHIFNITAVILVFGVFLTFFIFGLLFNKEPPQDADPTYPTEDMLEISAIEPDPEMDYPAINDRLSASYPTVQNMRSRQGDIYVGNPPYVYELLPDGFFRLRYVYPLFFQEEIVAAVKMSSERKFFPETLFHQFLQPFVGNSITIVSDDDACYAYDGTEFHLLYGFGKPDTEHRSSIEGAENISAFTEDLILTELTPVAVLEYEP